jgi:hypothetical protein
LEPELVKDILIRFRGLLIAVVALALSASLAFAAKPAAPGAAGRENAASHHAVKAASTSTGASAGEEENESGDEDVEGAGDGGDHCATDPRTLTPEELAAMNHGSIVCWAAHQKTWPAEFKNHGAWVSSWAHAGKGPDAGDAAKTKGPAKDKSKNKGLDD